ncbi:preprotein translocase subunit YajC [Planctomycetales bacterium]|nr:preprotein translocase subunit YajC [Planctomycetales bacterium]
MYSTLAGLPPLFSPLFAEGAAPPQNGGSGMFLFISLGLVMVLYWLFMLRPQQRQEDARRKLLNSLEKNDRVYTVGGLIGSVYTVDKEKGEIVLKIDDSNGTKVRFLLSAVASKIVEEEKKSS